MCDTLWSFLHTPLVDIDLICFCDTLPVHVQIRQPFLYSFCNFVILYLCFCVFIMCLYIFGRGHVQVTSNTTIEQIWEIQLPLKNRFYILVPFQPARPQCVPNNHQRANFREEEVQRVQEEILLRHAGRCTALLKDAFQPNALLSWTRRLDRSNTSGRRPLEVNATFPTCSKCCRVLRSVNVENQIHFFQSHFCFSKNSVEYLIASIFLPYLFLWTISNVFSLVLCFILFDNASISHAW